MKGLMIMKAYKNLTKAELEQLQAELAKAFEDACGKGLSLNMARGKIKQKNSGKRRTFSAIILPFNLFCVIYYAALTNDIYFNLSWIL